MIQTVALSKKGEKSDTNEDACLIIASKCLYVVADGVGGGPSGDFASRTLVDSLYEVCGTGELSEQYLVESIQAANKKVFEAAQTPSLNGMATTIALAYVSDNQIITMHVGDSRVYKITQGDILQLTNDHIKTVIKANDVKKQVVSNAIGVRDSVKIEVNHYEWREGDSLLLVSDGITDVLDDLGIIAILSNQDLPRVSRVSALIDECERLGGRDDKTVVLAFGLD